MTDTGPPSRSRTEFLAVLVRLRDSLGEWPTQPQYIEHKRPSDPSHTWLYDRSDEFGSWGAAIDAVRETYAEPDRPEGCRRCRDCRRKFVAGWEERRCGGCRGHGAE